MREGLNERARQRSAAALPSSRACASRCRLPRSCSLVTTVKVAKRRKDAPSSHGFFLVSLPSVTPPPPSFCPRPCPCPCVHAVFGAEDGPLCVQSSFFPFSSSAALRENAAVCACLRVCVGTCRSRELFLSSLFCVLLRVAALTAANGSASHPPSPRPSAQFCASSSLSSFSFLLLVFSAVVPPEMMLGTSTMERRESPAPCRFCLSHLVVRCTLSVPLPHRCIVTQANEAEPRYRGGASGRSSAAAKTSSRRENSNNDQGTPTP